MTKKIITLLLALACVLSLAACGKKNGSESTNAPEITTEAPTEAPTEAETEAPTEAETEAPAENGEND